MPNRVIRCGFLDSEKINALSEPEQLFFLRLSLVVDDYGRYDARPEMIKSHCYPVSDKCLTDVGQMTDKLATSKLITLYKVDGKKYLQINNFDQRLRQKREKYPPPPTCQTDDRQLSDTCPPESESESEIERKRKEEERKGLLRGGKQDAPKKAVINSKSKNGEPLTEEEAKWQP